MHASPIDPALAAFRRELTAQRYCPKCHHTNGEHCDLCDDHPENVRVRELREDMKAEFMEALQGDMNKPAYFAQSHSWLKNATVADALADALSDDPSGLMRRAMTVLANCAAGRGTQREAQQLLEQAVGAWVERWVE